MPSRRSMGRACSGTTAFRTGTAPSAPREPTNATTTSLASRSSWVPNAPATPVEPPTDPTRPCFSANLGSIAESSAPLSSMASAGAPSTVTANLMRPCAGSNGIHSETAALPAAVAHDAKTTRRNDASLDTLSAQRIMPRRVDRPRPRGALWYTLDAVDGARRASLSSTSARSLGGLSPGGGRLLLLVVGARCTAHDTRRAVRLLVHRRPVERRGRRAGDARVERRAGDLRR